MIIKIGNIELKDWSRILGNEFDYIRWPTNADPEGYFQDFVHLLVHNKGTEYNVYFHGSLRILENYYSDPKNSLNTEDMKQYIDKFIIRMSKLIVFI